MEDKMINMECVQDYNEILGVDTLHLSPNYFGDLVKRETGISAQEYIQNHIIEKAKSLLSDKHTTVSQASYALGYKYPNHLSRMFKRATGITPNEFKINN